MNAQKAVLGLQKAGWTDARIAKALDCSVHAVKQWEKGRRSKEISARFYKLFELHRAHA